ncbi:hypothetical protein [uncultured Sphingomonas sp.]|uniref:hypothetical protein n=1 Tax=uncultured Sphingomonas sp. TaxID=158754 RepID=UPI00262C4247|nr:hypothetical protein [uncultured Sphingomonas sp.]
MKTFTNKRAVASAFEHLITTANFSAKPDRILIQACTGKAGDAVEFDDEDGLDKLHVMIDDAGRITVDVGIATHWTTQWQGTFRPARTASGLLVLTGRQRGRPAYVCVEDGRLHIDRDTPFLSLADEAAAVAECASELAAYSVGGR